MLFKDTFLQATDCDYHVAADLEQNAICFWLVDEDSNRKWVAALIDSGDEITLARLSPQGILLTRINPYGLRRKPVNYKELMISASAGFRSVYDRIFVIERVNEDDHSLATISYCDDSTMYTVLICKTEGNRLAFGYAK